MWVSPSMTGYTGGIPAKYGDTTGGVIVSGKRKVTSIFIMLGRQDNSAGPA